ncbi:MAG: hypothetical protein C0618_00325 [Desulfuromonas sp.]|nr:MAG: hypothetical protein C0618_00325 [Desulfuromonas sp.]
MDTTPEKFYSDLMDELNAKADEAEAASAAELISTQARQRGDEGYALFFEGEALCLKGDMEQGNVLQKAATDLLPDVVFVLANHAVVLSRLGRVKPALAQLERALNIDPDDLLSISQKSICLCKLYRDEEALAWFDRALQIAPGDAHALRNKGVALSRLGRSAEAMRCFEEVLRLDPDDRHALSEKKILEDEQILRKTPFGWLILWVRKKVTPALMRMLRG